jgi:hypothetical protein
MSNEALCNLMLDALRRGILLSRGCAPIEETASEGMSLNDQKKRICQCASQLTHDQKLQVLLAVAHIAGFEALGAHNSGCFVDITRWTAAQIKQLSDVIRFASK